MAARRGVVLCAVTLLVAGTPPPSVPTQLSGLYQLPEAVKVMTPQEVTEPVPESVSPSSGGRVGGGVGEVTPSPRVTLKRPMRIRIKMRPKGFRPVIDKNPSFPLSLSKGSSGNDSVKVVPIRKRIKIIKVRRNKRPGKVGLLRGDKSSRRRITPSSFSPRERLSNYGVLRLASESTSSPSIVGLLPSPTFDKITHTLNTSPIPTLGALVTAAVGGAHHNVPNFNSVQSGTPALRSSLISSAPDLSTNRRAVQAISEASGSPVLGTDRSVTSSLSPFDPGTPLVPRTGTIRSHEPLKLSIEPPPVSPVTEPSPRRTNVASIRDVAQATKLPKKTDFSFRGAERDRGSEHYSGRTNGSDGFSSRGSVRASPKGPTRTSISAARNSRRGGPSQGRRRDPSPGQKRGPSRPVSSALSPSTPAESSRPLSIFFEDMHYINKASESGFCQAYCGSEASGTRIIETKAGRCPAIRPGSYRGDCQDECRYDSECPRQQRCCNNGCASVCLDPDFRRTCDQLTCPPGHVCVDGDSSQDAVCVDTAPKETGRCPSPSLWDARTRSCEEQCQYDSQCSGDQRCCSNGCALVCTAPDTRKLCDEISCEPGTACVESPTEDAQCFRTDEKFGLCPKLPATGSLGGGCQDTCRYDAQCADNTKCCNNGCASVCLAPRKPDCETTQCRVGFRCMQRRNGAPYCAAIPCKQDGEIIDIECNSCTCIQGYLLCSQEECPPVKPGYCPRLTRGYRGRCVEECTSDYDCSEDGKCCSTGCGHTCQKPVSEIVHPCRTVRFRCGDQTRCAATRGLCKPGQTCPLQPLCVSRSAPFCESCPPGKVCVLQKRPCPSGHCHRQPICIQLYSDDTIFMEDEKLELAVIAKQNPKKFF
ncbi:uncharacterized protein LOC122375493 isoform X2 [Amphibalanus amphitrite]|uniref:uncharacterized protein LOC122375493 isoform X2 n=1 Tax=Amphibalanus amphitrite TaxID=1232801 RepID=UPI001C914F6A|nr:uncharacterized protein LOC122375493 isoform X2 [Amphibalanus amphitrite]